VELKYVGVGIYSVPDASRLTGVHPSTIYRWVRGYERHVDGKARTSAPVFRRDFPELKEPLCLSFADMIEIRYVDAFRDQGLTWATIRDAHVAASSRFETGHPFSTGRFRTEGRAIFEDMRADHREKGLREVVTGQHQFAEMLVPALRGLRFAQGRPDLWWPMVDDKRIVIDPKRRFGAPIVDRVGIAASVLARYVENGDSVERVAHAYGIELRDVEVAVEFQRLFFPRTRRVA